MNPTTNQTTGIICILAFVVIGSMLYIWTYNSPPSQSTDTPTYLYAQCVKNKIINNRSINECGYILHP